MVCRRAKLGGRKSTCSKCAVERMIKNCIAGPSFESRALGTGPIFAWVNDVGRTVRPQGLNRAPLARPLPMDGRTGWDSGWCNTWVRALIWSIAATFGRCRLDLGRFRSSLDRMRSEWDRVRPNPSRIRPDTSRFRPELNDIDQNCADFDQVRAEFGRTWRLSLGRSTRLASSSVELGPIPSIHGPSATRHWSVVDALRGTADTRRAAPKNGELQRRAEPALTRTM